MQAERPEASIWKCHLAPIPAARRSARGDIGFLTKPLSELVRRFPEAGGGLFSTTHDIVRYGLMLAKDGELGHLA